MNTEELRICFWVWLTVSFFFLVKIRSRIPTSGLTAAFVVSLSMNHLLGAGIYLLPWYSSPDGRYVKDGFQLTLYGLLAFCVGAYFFAPLAIQMNQSWLKVRREQIPNPLLPIIYLITGLFFYGILASAIRNIPSLRTFITAGWHLLQVSLCLGCWQSWRTRNKKVFFFWLFGSLLFPFYTVSHWGFLSYGIVALTIILIFVVYACRIRFRTVLLITPLVLFAGLSLFVTYMQERSDIRDALWQENVHAEDTQTELADIYRNFEWFDIRNKRHLAKIDLRLNQNYLLGVSKAHLESGRGDFAQGETLWFGLMALVPRIIWPEKPVSAGGMGLVSQYTGIQFSETTSVGIGQVMEFYVNFGVASLLIGMFVFGISVAVFDAAATYRLVAGDYQGFVFYFLPGLVLTQALRSLVETTSYIAAMMVFCLVINYFLQATHHGASYEQR